MRFCSALFFLLVVCAILSALLALAYYGITDSGQIDSKILIHQFIFSLKEGSISALLSVFIGYIAARGLFYLKVHEALKAILLGFCALCFVLPSIVVALGIIQVYAPLFDSLDSKIYGYSGILIAHVFFNAPFCALVFYSLLGSISKRDFDLARTLRLTGIHFVYFLEILRFKGQAARLFFIVFAICFSSFTLVLLLGGSPRFSTLEVGIYQSLNFELNLKRASLISLFQIAFYIILYFFIPKGEDVLYKHTGHEPKKSAFSVIFTLTFFGFLLLPLLSIIFDGLHGILESRLSVNIKSALVTSILSSALSSALCVILALFVGVSNKRTLNFLSVLVFGMPAISLSFGLFLIFKDFELNYFQLLLIVSGLNAIVTLPFVSRILNFERIYAYDNLCLSLKISGFRRFFMIDLPLLKASIIRAISLAFCLGLGDFSAIALFGMEDFKTLTSLLFGALGSYRSYDASIIALLLLSMVLVVFTLSNLFSNFFDLFKKNVRT